MTLLAILANVGGLCHLADHGTNPTVDADKVWEQGVQTIPRHVEARPCIPHLDRVEKVTVGLDKPSKVTFRAFEVRLGLAHLIEQFAH